MDPTSEQMLPGERPTEAGYYVARPFVQALVEGGQVVQVVDDGSLEKPFQALIFGSVGLFPLDDFEWIARITMDWNDPRRSGP